MLILEVSVCLVQYFMLYVACTFSSVCYVYIHS